jgi:hypothetical protein
MSSSFALPWSCIPIFLDKVIESILLSLIFAQQGSPIPVLTLTEQAKKRDDEIAPGSREWANFRLQEGGKTGKRKKDG